MSTILTYAVDSSFNEIYPNMLTGALTQTAENAAEEGHTLPAVPEGYSVVIRVSVEKVDDETGPDASTAL